MPYANTDCVCGGTGWDGCRPRVAEDPGYGIFELRNALASDAASQVLFSHRLSGLREGIALDALRLSDRPRSTNPLLQAQLSAPSTLTDPITSYLSKERHAELP
jgi:hypothetical protein